MIDRGHWEWDGFADDRDFKWYQTECKLFVDQLGRTQLHSFEEVKSIRLLRIMEAELTAYIQYFNTRGWVGLYEIAQFEEELACFAMKFGTLPLKFFSIDLSQVPNFPSEDDLLLVTKGHMTRFRSLFVNELVRLESYNNWNYEMHSILGTRTDFDQFQIAEKICEIGIIIFQLKSRSGLSSLRPTEIKLFRILQK